MEIESKLFKSVAIDVCIIGDGAQNANCGYLLIKDELVPHSLIERFAEALCTQCVYYGHLLSVPLTCGEELWESLTERQRNIAGDILLLLLEQGWLDVLIDEEGSSTEYCAQFESA